MKKTEQLILDDHTGAVRLEIYRIAGHGSGYFIDCPDAGIQGEPLIARDPQAAVDEARDMLLKRRAAVDWLLECTQPGRTFYDTAHLLGE